MLTNNEPQKLDTDGYTPSKIKVSIDDVQQLMAMLQTLQNPGTNNSIPAAGLDNPNELPALPKPTRIDILRTLLTLDNERFIQRCYLMFLGRKPDEFGRNSCLDGLQRLKILRFDMLMGLLHSPEAKLRRASIPFSHPQRRVIRLTERVGRKLLRFSQVGKLIRVIRLLQYRPAVIDVALHDSVSTLRRNMTLLATIVGQTNDTNRFLQKEREKMLGELAQLQELHQKLLITTLELQQEQSKLALDRDKLIRRQNAFQETFNQIDTRQTFVESKLASTLLAEKSHLRVDSQAATSLPTAEAGSEEKYARYYFEFERTFRGEEVVVKERVAFYLDLLNEEMTPLLDLGCGRGEWLEVLKENGIPAFGVDSNQASFARCAAKGLDCRYGDVMEFLRTLPDASVGAVSALHLVEHLPWTLVLDLIEESRRVLKTGGLLILETPNPENILVSSLYFYHDPTHRNPIVPSVLKFTVEYFDFTEVEILRFRPSEILSTVELQEWAQPLARSFNATQDFAIIGRKGKA